MSTHPLTRLNSCAERRRSREQAIAAAALPPDPDVWITLLCRRCEQPFRFQGIATHCVKCIKAAADAGIIGAEHIGEVSGA